MDKVEYNHPTNGFELPYMIDLPDLDVSEFVTYYKKQAEYIDEKLTTIGAVKFCGIQIDSIEDFQVITDSISSKFLSYIDGNSPRVKLTNSVYTSTEYDKTQKITMHNELSYSAKWPNKLFFTCIEPAEVGGETLLADSRKILSHMDKEIVSEIEKKGIVYIRNLNNGVGMGPSWQDTFETEDKGEIEAYCEAYSIDYQWNENESLKLSQYRDGIIAHRKSGEKVWFNQIDQFHPIQLGEEMFDGLLALYDSPENFPTYVRYGDGTEISNEVVKEILNLTHKVTHAPLWNRNELLIVDNELVSHGRNPYVGDRSVLVAMSE